MLAALLAVPVAAAKEAPEEEAVELRPRHQRWYESVDLLLSDAEREVFLALKEDYQRDHFIRRFWKVRDPYPRTARNEMQEAWEARAEEARQQFGDLGDERAHMFLQMGEPSRRKPPSCTDTLRPLEIWIYDQGSEVVGGYFTLVFIATRGRSGYRLWHPLDGLAELMSSFSSTAGVTEGQLARHIRERCTRGEDILSDLAQSLDLSRLERGASLVPRPSDEWVRTFRARSTDVAEDVEPLAAEMAVDYPGRHQSRTVVQSLVAVERASAEPAAVGEHRIYSFLIDGEVLREGELFDHFRYRFTFPVADLASEQVPLVVQRYLRPGEYQLILKVEDIGSGRVFRGERALEVPRVEVRRDPVVYAEASPAGAAGTPAADTEAAEPPAPPAVVRTRLLQDRLGEANASIATGDQSIRLLPLPEILSVGRLRVEAATRGEGIARVAFELNGRPVMKKSRPPYSVELNLGDKPRVHTLRAIALDSEGRSLASDEVLINAGPHRFSVRLLEPRPGKTYTASVRVHAEVTVPEGERLDRLELYLNDSLLATLYQPPFEQPILLQRELPFAYVRVVAYLQGGNKAEDVVIINAPDYIDETEVQLVELYTSAVDRKGNFVEGLGAGDFEVYEDDRRQQIRRFELVRDIPVHAGLVLDTSISMTEELRDVEKAAFRFFETVLTEKDRASVITFADEPRLAVRFTNDKGILAGGLAGLTAEGETALYDSIVFALHYFSGLSGKRAVILLTDGEDSRSQYSYDDAVEFARRTGAAIYVVGLNLSSQQSETRLRMQRLARETGGECFFIDRAAELGRVYERVQEELRSQYLIAYQSTQTEGIAFREIEVKSLRKGVEAKTLRGYFP